jgi:aspartyl aminopeptidase
MKLTDFIKKAPTAWHATHEMCQKLLRSGFTELHEKEKWSLKSGKSYFVQRNQSSLIAFHLPKKELESSITLAAHTDSPCLKVKPQGEFEKDNLAMINFEVYGAPILSSWLNRDLALAGRVFYRKSKDKIQSELVTFTEYPLMIPQLAIHLDREVNEAGVKLNKQEHLSAIGAAINQLPKDTSYLHYLLKKQVGSHEILHHELFAYPLEAPRHLGVKEEFLASFRLDNLVSCHAAIEAIAESKAQENKLQIAAFWNHEEVGSESSEGAGSSFFLDTLERIVFHLGLDKEEYLRLKANSYTLSVDVSHATHPNYKEKHDERHKALLGGGVCVKTNAQERYTSHGEITAKLLGVWKEKEIKIQPYVSRTDIPSGSTIGPIHSARTGIPSIDIGVPLLSMHAARELIHGEDHVSLKNALKLALNA